MRIALLALIGCAHGAASDGNAELAKARVAVAKGKPSEAIALYDHVPRFSAAWPRALFEGGRERARINNYSLALGMFLTLRAPQLSDWVFPEAYAIEAEIYLRNCYFAQPLAIARAFRTSVLPLRERVMDLVAGAPIGEEVPQIATRLTGARTPEQQWERLDQLLVEIDLAERVIARIEEEANAMAAKLVDNGRAGADMILIVTDEHHRWHFDGEFWPDELGNYRVPIVSRCARISRGSISS